MGKYRYTGAWRSIRRFDKFFFCLKMKLKKFSTIAWQLVTMQEIIRFVLKNKRENKLSISKKIMSYALITLINFTYQEKFPLWKTCQFFWICSNYSSMPLLIKFSNCRVTNWIHSSGLQYLIIWKSIDRSFFQLQRIKSPKKWVYYVLHKINLK